MKLTRSTGLAWRSCSVKRPSLVVPVPMVVPSTTTEAAGSGCPFSSTTVPLMVTEGPPTIGSADTDKVSADRIDSMNNLNRIDWVLVIYRFAERWEPV